MAGVEQSEPRAEPQTAEGAAAEVPFAELVATHQRMVWRYLRLLGADPTEADDLMQDTFVRVAEGAQLGERLHAPAAFLRGVARNLLIGARRRARRQAPAGEWMAAVERLAAREVDPFEDARIEALRRCVARLQGRMRQAVEWHHRDGVPTKQVAQRLGIGMDGIKSLLSRARQLLRECVEQQARGERTS